MKLVQGDANHGGGGGGQSRIQKEWGECGDSQADFTDVSKATAEGKQRAMRPTEGSFRHGRLCKRSGAGVSCVS